MMQKMEPKIVHTHVRGGNKAYIGRSVGVTIPIEYARAFDIDKPTNVLVTATDKGILISKLEIKQ